MSESKYLYIINNVLQGYDRDVVVNHVDELEQQNKELRELLNDVIGVLMHHEQQHDKQWLSDYLSCCERYDKLK